MLNITMYNIIQNNITEIWAVKDCVKPLWASQGKNAPNHLLFFYIFMENSVCHDSAWYDEDFERIYQK